MSAKDSLTDLIERQIEIENTNVKEIDETEKKIGSTAARLFLSVIRLDSKKHAEILKGMLEVLRGIPASKTLWEHSLDTYIGPIVARKELEAHTKREADMIAHVEREMKQTDDEGLKLLLQHIADDERRHHKILEAVTKHLHKIEK